MLNDLFGKNFKTVFLAIIIVELLSFWAQQFFWLNVAVFAAVVVLALVLSWIKLDYGFYLVLTELFIGSKGYLFYAEVDGFRLSLRIGLFLAVMAVWLIKACRDQHLLFFRGSNRYLFYYLGLGLFVMLAALNGGSERSLDLALKIGLPLGVLALHRAARALGRSVFFAAGLLLAVSVLAFGIFKLQPFKLYL